MKEYKPMKTLSVKLVVENERGTALGTYYYSSESSESFFSSAYLYNQIDKGITRLF